MRARGFAERSSVSKEKRVLPGRKFHGAQLPRPAVHIYTHMHVHMHINKYGFLSLLHEFTIKASVVSDRPDISRARRRRINTRDVHLPFSFLPRLFHLRFLLRWFIFVSLFASPYPGCARTTSLTSVCLTSSSPPRRPDSWVVRLGEINLVLAREFGSPRLPKFTKLGTLIPGFLGFTVSVAADYATAMQRKLVLNCDRPTC